METWPISCFLSKAEERPLLRVEVDGVGSVIHVRRPTGSNRANVEMPHLSPMVEGVAYMRPIRDREAGNAS